MHDFGYFAKPVVQAIRASPHNGAYVLNWLNAMDGATVLGLVEFAFGVVLKKVAYGLAGKRLLEQTNVDVSDELLDVGVLLAVVCDFGFVKFVDELFVINLLDKAWLLVGYSLHTLSKKFAVS